MNTSVSKLSIYMLTDFVQSAATNFNGKEPETTLSTAANSRIEWPVSTNAGLISLDSLGLSGMYKICHVSLAMAGQSGFSIDIVDSDGKVTNLVTGTTATSYNSVNLGYISSTQSLRITSTGTTTSFKATVGLADARWGTVA